MTEHWPAVSYDRWGATCDTLHARTEVLGKLAVELALPAPDGSGSLVVSLDLHAHEAVVEHSCGSVQRVLLVPDRPVAEVTQDVLAAVVRAGGTVRINPVPQEVPWSVPLDEDYEHASYDPGQVEEYFAAATQAALALAAFRAPYRGRSTPVNAWWGSFDPVRGDWDDVRAAPDPHAAAVDFLRSAFHHVYRKAGWSAELGATAEGSPPPLR